MPSDALRIFALGLRGFPDVQGGIEKHAEKLYPRLTSLGCSVAVIGRTGYRQSSSAHEWCGVRFHWIWAPRLRGVESLLHSLFGVLYAAVMRPDILHIHAVGPALVAPLARALGLTVVVTHHGPDYERQKWGRIAKQVLKLGEALGMRAAHERIVISTGIRDLVRRKYGVDAHLIPNGVDLTDQEPGGDAPERFELVPRRYVLQVSRLVPEKRQLDLIAAFEAAGLVGWKLVLVGDTEFPDAYSDAVREAARRNPSIVCTGFQTGQMLHELYANAAVFVLPSSYEGLPIALLEALSYGLETFASDISPNREVGLEPDAYFELGNIEQLADLLRRAATNPMPEDVRWQRSTRILARFDWDAIARQTLSVYTRAVTLGSSTSRHEEDGVRAALTDRLLHHAHLLKCGPRSWRTKLQADLQD